MKPAYIATIVVFVNLILSNCTGQSGQSQVAAPVQSSAAATQSTTIDIETFTDIPDEIDGGACYFAKSAADKEKERYVFVGDFGVNAFARLDGKLLRFERTEINEKTGDAVFANNSYRISLVFNQKQKAKDDGIQVGTLTVWKGNVSKTVSFIGECNC